MQARKAVFKAIVIDSRQARTQPGNPIRSAPAQPTNFVKKVEKNTEIQQRTQRHIEENGIDVDG